MTHRHFARGLAAAALVGLALTAAPTHAQFTCDVDYQAGRLAHWAAGKVFYQVFVRSFADSDGDGIGDFNGLTARLDYLNDGDPATDADLGIDAIWLMPITQSPSYHGYDTVDYYALEEDYGEEADFDAFVEAAHARGIKVIMDLVVNHLSAQHPWFRDANRSVDDPYHDWFVWRDHDPGWVRPWAPANTWHKSRTLPLYYYGLFWGGMPDLNYENPEVRAEMLKIARHWLARGVDGFRLDASRHIIEAGDPAKAAGSPETHEFWREFSRAIRGDYPHALFVGENWTSIDEVAPYYGDKPYDQLDMNFNFDLSSALVSALNAGLASPVYDALCAVAEHYPPHALDATFLTNHDMVRVLTQLRDDRTKARLGASLLLTLPGVPFIYYGEEIGLRNGPGDEDPEKRTPMPWTAEGGFTTGEPWMVNRKADPDVHVAAQTADEDSLLNHYKALIRLRGGHPALSSGGFRPLDALDDDVLAFERFSGDQRLIVIANMADKAQTIALPYKGVGGAKRLFGAGVETATGDDMIMIEALPATALVVLDLD